MAESYNTNLLNVAENYLRYLRVHVTATSLKRQLTENPFFPSLYALSSVFDRFHIPHHAFKLDGKNLNELTPPFIAYLKNQPNGKDFVLVTSVTENEVQYIADDKSPKKVLKEGFLNDWEHIVLHAEPNEESGEKDYVLNRKKERTQSSKTKVLTGASALILLATLFFSLQSLPAQFIVSAGALLLIKMAGIAATVLLLIYETDKSNAFVKSILHRWQANELRGSIAKQRLVFGGTKRIRSFCGKTPSKWRNKRTRMAG